MSRGLSNNNPGNIRISNETFQGEIKPSKDASFKQFQTIEYGYRALFKIIFTYTRKYGLNTISGIISRWAPETENDTTAYISFVESKSGINRNTEFTGSDDSRLIEVVKAISWFENGEQAISSHVTKGYEMAGGVIEQVKDFVEKKKA